jgi:hypothetical protein
VLGPTVVHAEADGCLGFISYKMDLTGEGSTFLFFIFLVCCMLGEAKVPSVSAFFPSLCKDEKNLSQRVLGLVLIKFIY